MDQDNDLGTYPFRFGFGRYVARLKSSGGARHDADFVVQLDRGTGVGDVRQRWSARGLASQPTRRDVDRRRPGGERFTKMIVVVQHPLRTSERQTPEDADSIPSCQDDDEMVPAWHQQPVRVGFVAGDPLMRRGVEVKLTRLVPGYNEAGVENYAQGDADYSAVWLRRESAK